jgi:hypothetical protein
MPNADLRPELSAKHTTEIPGSRRSPTAFWGLTQWVHSDPTGRRPRRDTRSILGISACVKSAETAG